MKKMLSDALELIEGLETHPEWWVCTTDGLSIMVGHLFAIFDIENPWSEATILVSGDSDVSGNKKLAEAIETNEARLIMKSVKKFLVEQGRLEVDPTPDDPDAYKVRLPFGLSS